MQTLTFIYSSRSVEALKDVFAELQHIFGRNNIPDFEDIFYYGVFCKPCNYAFFKYWDDAPDSLEIPEIITNGWSKKSEKLDYVRKTINEIMRGEIKKPEWMKYVEEEEICNQFEAAPSTFLNLLPKEEKYQGLANTFLYFLYSPNMMVTELK